MASRTHRATRRAAARIASRAKTSGLGSTEETIECFRRLVGSKLSLRNSAPFLSTRRRAWRPPQRRPRASAPVPLPGARGREPSRRPRPLAAVGTCPRARWRRSSRSPPPIPPATCSRARRRSRCGATWWSAGPWTSPWTPTPARCSPARSRAWTSRARTGARARI